MRASVVASAGLALWLAAGRAGAEGAPKRDLSFVAVPIPISDPAIGNGVAAVGVALYHAGGSERPWITGVGGLYTDTRSWAGAVFQKAYVGHDRFRLTAGAGKGEFNVDFFGIGQAAGARGVAIPIVQEGQGGLVQGLVRVAPHLYVGAHYRMIDMTTTIDVEEPPFPDLTIAPFELNSKSSALGLAGEFDTRDSEIQPKRGLYATATWLVADEALGSDFDYSRVEAKLSGYHGLGPKAVVAWRASACWAGDGAPFYDICNFGTGNDLRGYTGGQYRDHAMYAVQAEYRRHLFWRVGAVAFAGVGGVAESFGEMSTDRMLPAAGLGLRLQASKRYGANVSVDYAWGKDSQGLYFYVGEAF